MPDFHWMTVGHVSQAAESVFIGYIGSNHTSYFLANYLKQR